MNEEKENINPWAKKLEEINVPGMLPQWRAMKLKLDNKMPVSKKKKRLRWLLLILLLLLLVGVCNRRTLLNLNKFAEENNKNLPQKNSSADKNNLTGINKDGIKNIDSLIIKNMDRVNLKNTNNKTFVNKKLNSEEDPITNTHPVSRAHVLINYSRKEKVNSGKSNIIFTTGNKNITAEKSFATKETDTSGIEEEDKSQNIHSTETSIENGSDSMEAKGKSVASINSDPVENKKNTDSSHQKKPDSKPVSKKDLLNKKSNRIGLAAGLGINQFFTVGAQQHSDYNSNGTSGVLSDYIPVPMVRIYFNKKLYIQLEAQFNTPQYTKNLLASRMNNFDSLGTGIPVIQNSVIIKKLFYFNIPLSIHYSPFKNFYTGTGMQFSRLTNGVGSFESKAIFGTGLDSLIFSKTKSFKTDTVYKEIKTNEWRFLADVNYQWRNLVLGLQYNQALNKFIHVPIAAGQVTQARNSSIQFYLRYILWKNKKAKELLPR